VPAKYVVSKKRGGFGVVLKASNGKQLADLGTLKDKRAVNNAIAALAKNAPTTTVEGLEEPPAKTSRKAVAAKSGATKAGTRTASGRKATSSTTKSSGGTASRATKSTAARATKTATTAKSAAKRATPGSSAAKRTAKRTTAVAATS